MITKTTVRKIPHESAYVVRGYNAAGVLVASCEESTRQSAADTANAMMAENRATIAIRQFGEAIASELAAIPLPSDTVLAEEFTSELRHYVRVRLDSCASGEDESTYSPRQLAFDALESIHNFAECIDSSWQPRESSIVRRLAAHAGTILESRYAGELAAFRAMHAALDAQFAKWQSGALALAIGTLAE